eukprot:COSAG05_NODE_1300_length_5243_cov_15.420101_5_plen_460_part_00
MEAAAAQLSQDTAGLWCPRQVARLDVPPSALAFLRGYVSTSTPCVIRNALGDGCPAAAWTLPSIADKMGDALVTVDITPDGLGDAVKPVGGVPTFVKPEQRRMTVRKLAQHLELPESLDGIPYLSYQNDSLRTEFPALAADAPAELDWATAAFGSSPDAVNLWVGDGRAVSSVHKDHYENLYCVISGAKTFTLLPPSDIAFMGEAEYPSASYKFARGSWGIVPDLKASAGTPDQSQQQQQQQQTVPWVALDPAATGSTREAILQECPQFARARPITVTVAAGEALYLPALWYHRVGSVSGEVTIALNYWHDMHFGAMFMYHNLVQRLAPLLSSTSPPPAGDPKAERGGIVTDSAGIQRGVNGNDGDGDGVEESLSFSPIRSEEEQAELALLAQQERQWALRQATRDPQPSPAPAPGADAGAPVGASEGGGGGSVVDREKEVKPGGDEEQLFRGTKFFPR